MNNVRGFTLVELIIVVAIIGILAAIAYPAYTEQVAASRRADGQAALVQFANAMERYFTRNNGYTGAADGGADTGAPAAAVFPSQAPLDGGTKYYNLTISAATASSYTLRATPIGGQADDGLLELDHTGARRWDRDDDGDASEAGEDCWEKSC